MTPQEFEGRVNWWRLRLNPLGLTHWKFVYEWSEEPVEDKDGIDAEATVRVHQSYDTAFWHIPETTLSESREEIDHVIVHELMHVAMRDLNRVERDMLYELGGPAGRVHDARLDHAIEALVERLARAVVGIDGNLVP